MINRFEALKSWLTLFFKETPYTCTPLAGDASFRRYWRVNTGIASYVVMDAPPPETTLPFIEIAALLRSQGLLVPQVFATNLELGFLLLSDMGDISYLGALKTGTKTQVQALYHDALLALVKIHSITPSGLSRAVGTFDVAFMQQQLGVFNTWYLQVHLQQPREAMQSILPLLDTVLKVIHSQPYVFIHRDYHSRNLMVCTDNNPGILDFQDAMIGPIVYDAVSLFQDCYITWPREQVVEWVLNFKTQLIDASLLSPTVSDAQWIQWFDWTGLQRHLKNLGVFARLHHRDGKSQYLGDIPMICQYLYETCEHYPNLMPLWHFLKTAQESLKCVL